MSISLAVLCAAAVLQTLIYLLSGSVALLADLIHNFGDGLTALPLGIAFVLRSGRAERWAGLGVVAWQCSPAPWSRSTKRSSG